MIDAGIEPREIRALEAIEQIPEWEYHTASGYFLRAKKLERKYVALLGSGSEEDTERIENWRQRSLLLKQAALYMSKASAILSWAGTILVREGCSNQSLICRDLSRSCRVAGQNYARLEETDEP